MSFGNAAGHRSTSWLGEVYDVHAPALVRYLSARVGAGPAEDLLSEVFEVAIRRQHTFDEARGTPAAWLFGIATNVLRQHRRQEAQHWRTQSQRNDRHLEPDDVSGRAVDSADALTAARNLAPALQSLDDIDRDILLLTSWAQLTPQEIGLVIDMPAGTVRSRLHRVRHKLRSSITPPPTAQPPANATLGRIDNVAH